VKIVVYTSVIGNYDGIRSSQWPMLCFTDRAAAHLNRSQAVPRGVEWRRPLHVAATAARTARWHKWNAHLVAPDADVSVWLDGTHSLTAPPARLVECLGASDVATFVHRSRDCIYDEAAACIDVRKDTRERLMAQVARYLDEYPLHGGLWETQVVVRRHCAATQGLNEAVWREIEGGSHRDQVSFPVVARRLGVSVAAIPGTGYVNAFTRFARHNVAPGVRRG
jgi:hypothetical protein